MFFILAIRFLSRKLAKVIQSNELELYKVGGVEVENHLIYGDDLTLFYRAS